MCCPSVHKILILVLTSVLSMSKHLFFPRRDLLPSTEMMASADPRQIHIASHLGPTVPQHTNMPNILSNRVYPGPGNEALSVS